MKRPVGVILSAIVLGLLALLQLGGAAIMGFGATVLRQHPPNASVNPMPAGFVSAVIIGCVILFLLLAGWAIATLIGILKLENWARYSILVIGGCMAVLGVISIFGIVVAATVMPPSSQGLPAHTMQAVLAFYGFLYAIVVAIGVWWLIYFNQRKTKAYFLPHYARNPTMAASGYLAAPPYTAAHLAPGDAPPYPQAYLAPPPRPGRFTHVPTAIIVLACLFLVGALSCLLVAALPMPGFFFGIVIPRPESHFVYLAFALLSGAIGVGFLRLDNWSRILCYVYMALGVLNMLCMVTPWGQARYAIYNQLIFHSMNAGPAPPSPFKTLPLVVLMLVVVVLFNGAIVWFLERHRYAFLKQPPPPPDPLKTPLTF